MSNGNPYASPPPVRGRARISRKLERQVVAYFWQCRKQPPTSFSLWMRFIPAWGIMILGVTAMILAGSVVLPPQLLLLTALFGAGVTVGALLRDLSFCLRISKQWPVLEELLDWDKIDQKHDSAPGVQK